METSLQQLHELLDKTRQEIQKIIIGQNDVIDACLIAILTRNHALLEGVPGVGKTLLVRTLSEVLGVPFGRIQFTPDLMPTDITGTNVFQMNTGEFSLVKGPVFTTFLLGDEINRAPAKTQSALLQAMQERKVTIDRNTYDLDENFTVFATQNPIEYEGTYPLPEAQKDRFMVKISMAPMDSTDEQCLAVRTLEGNSPEYDLESGKVQAVMTPELISSARETLRSLTVREELIHYAVQIVRATRESDCVLTGAGPRASQALVLSSRANAALDGRDFVTPDDIKSMALPVLGHRINLRPEYELEGMTEADVIARILDEVAVPR